LNAATHSLENATAPSGTLGAPVEAALIVVAALMVVGVIIALAELAVRVSRQRADQPGVPVLSAPYAQRLYGRALYVLGPSLVAGAVTLIHTQQVDQAAYLMAVMIVSGTLLRSDRHALHLMPLARLGFNAFVVAAGVALAMAPNVFGAGLIDAPTGLSALVAGVLMTLVAAPLENRFESGAPIRLAVIGPSTFADRLDAELSETGIRGYSVVGYLDVGADPDGRVAWLGALESVREAVRREAIDLLVVSPMNQRLTVFEQTAKACLDLPVRMIEATALYENVLGHVPIGTINSAWFQFIMHPRFSPSSPLSKRVLDLVVSAVMITAAIPLMALCAIAIKLDDRGPVFYRQRRVGEEGREFEMLKFRTLRPDADNVADVVPEDQLVTRVGTLLQKMHLNELPQLLQVLRGEMSLVGPRPEPPALVEELSSLVPYYERRALVKPGLTGWAQVRCGYAGSNFGTAWKVCHDLYYIKHRSAQFDLLILLQTLHVLIEREGEEQMPAPAFVLGESLDLDHPSELVRP
jgi:exopolysaccharide biosynthesis polyprenyl glycosylphosphotransferase